MLFVTAVRKIQACDVHPGLDELANGFSRAAGSSDGGNNLGGRLMRIKQVHPKNSLTKWHNTGVFGPNIPCAIFEQRCFKLA
jgi:hypothetical protein